MKPINTSTFTFSDLVGGGSAIRTASSGTAMTRSIRSAREEAIPSQVKPGFVIEVK